MEIERDGRQAGADDRNNAAGKGADGWHLRCPQQQVDRDADHGRLGIVVSAKYERNPRRQQIADDAATSAGKGAYENDHERLETCLLRHLGSGYREQG